VAEFHVTNPHPGGSFETVEHHRKELDMGSTPLIVATYAIDDPTLWKHVLAGKIAPKDHSDPAYVACFEFYREVFPYFTNDVHPSTIALAQLLSDPEEWKWMPANISLAYKRRINGSALVDHEESVPPEIVRERLAVHAAAAIGTLVLGVKKSVTLAGGRHNAEIMLIEGEHDLFMEPLHLPANYAFLAFVQDSYIRASLADWVTHKEEGNVGLHVRVQETT
jgi:hypothetical protein